MTASIIKILVAVQDDRYEFANYTSLAEPVMWVSSER
jgi:hypothetical protein